MKTWTGVVATIAAMAAASVVFGQENPRGARGERPDRPGRKNVGMAGPEAREHAQRQRRESRAFMEQQRKENESLRQEIEDLAGPDKIKEIRAHRARQIGENVEFFKKQHQENIDFVKNSDTLPAERKAEILANMEKRHQAATAFWAGIREENQAFFARLGANPDMNLEQKKEALQKFIRTQREKIREWREAHRPRLPGGGEPPHRRDGPRPDGAPAAGA